MTFIPSWTLSHSQRHLQIKGSLAFWDVSVTMLNHKGPSLFTSLSHSCTSTCLTSLLKFHPVPPHVNPKPKNTKLNSKLQIKERGYTKDLQVFLFFAGSSAAFPRFITSITRPSLIFQRQVTSEYSLPLHQAYRVDVHRILNY